MAANVNIAEDLTFDIPENESVGKKPKKEKPPKGEAGGKSGGKGGVIAGVLLIAVIGGLAGVIALNPAGLRDKYLAPVLKNVPVLKDLVKSPEEAAPEDPAGMPEGAPAQPSVSAAELQARIAELEAQLADEKKLSDMKQQEIDRLAPVEAAQADFRAEKADFDKLIAENDPAAYTAYYEKIDPQNAENLYPTLKADLAREKEIKRYIGVISEMDASNSAAMLEQLIGGDLPLVIEILKKLDANLAGEILNEMTPENAAAVAKRWSPIQY
ncbi:MAG: hypothetical protein LBU36_03690 [Clostridiales bacterium]|jgi:flagellar motility protein MotE (MotC chaperone)|nr:hypothetical protein [Clostridiales bacterium]